MAVENKYVDSDIATYGYGPSGTNNSAQQLMFRSIVAIAAADSDTSVYRFGRAISAEAIIDAIEIANDAITAGTVYDVGVYNVPTSATITTGAVVDVDCFANDLDMSAATTLAVPKNGMAAVTLANANYRLWEHAGHSLTTKKPHYDLALTAATVGSAAGSIVVTVYYHFI